MIRKKEPFKNAGEMMVSHSFRVRFNETDALGIVWHGNYITYFEDGREAFGRAYGISYLEVMEKGFSTPIVASSCKHKLSLRYGDVARIETSIVNTAAAKLIFQYVIYDPNEQVVCTGETVQVFLNANGELQLTNPAFIVEWKQKFGLSEQ